MAQHAIITDAHVRLCMLRGTKIYTAHHTSRYYYKGLCVVAHTFGDNARQETVSAFWILNDATTQLTFKGLLRRRERKNTVYKKASLRLLMPKQA
jgi:hypothetical protein